MGASLIGKGIFLLASSIIICVSQLHLKYKDKKETLLGSTIITVFICAILIVIWKTVGTLFSIYELLLIDFVLASFFAMIVYPLIRKKPVDYKGILRFVCFCSVAVACYSILTYGQTVIHSDSATANKLFISQVSNGSYFPKTWNYANGSIWILSRNVLVGVASIFLKSQSLIRSAASVMLVVLTVVALAFQSKKLFKNDSWLVSVPILLVALWGGFDVASGYLAEEGSDMILYQAAYTAQLLWQAVLTTLVFLFYKNEKDKKNEVVLGIVIFLLFSMLSTGGIRTLAERSLPLCCVLLLIVIRNCFKDQKFDLKSNSKTVKAITLTVVSSCAGTLINRALGNSLSTHSTAQNETLYASSVDDVIKNIGTAFGNLLKCFGYFGSNSLVSIFGIRNLIAVVLCLAFCFIIPYLQYERFGEANDATKFFFAYGMVHNFVMILLVVLFNKYEPRYLLTTVFVCVIISINYLFNYMESSKSFFKKLFCFCVAAVMIVDCICLLSFSNNWRQRLDDKRVVAYILLEHGLTKGYASFWNAYSQEIYSDMQLTMGGVTVTSTNVSPYHWLVDDSVFNDSGEKTFLMLTCDENALLSDDINEIFNNPIETFEISDYVVYVFDYDIVTNMSNGIEDGLLFPRDLCVNNFGSITTEKLSIDPGGISFGPYCQLSAGDYTITIVGKKLDTCKCDVYSETKNNQINFEEVSKSGNEVVMRVHISKSIRDFEVRAINDGDSVASIEKVIVK